MLVFLSVFFLQNKNSKSSESRALIIKKAGIDTAPALILTEEQSKEIASKVNSIDFVLEMKNILLKMERSAGTFIGKIILSSCLEMKQDFILENIGICAENIAAFKNGSSANLVN